MLLVSLRIRHLGLAFLLLLVLVGGAGGAESFVEVGSSSADDGQDDEGHKEPDGA